MDMDTPSLLAEALATRDPDCEPSYQGWAAAILATPAGSELARRAIAGESFLAYMDAKHPSRTIDTHKRLAAIGEAVEKAYEQRKEWAIETMDNILIHMSDDPRR